MLQKIFGGKKKFLTIPLIVGLLLWFWPFIIGATLSFLAIKHIEYSKVKYLIVFFLTLFTLPIGSAWVLALTDSSPDTQKVAGEQTVNTTPTITLAPTSTNTPTSTVSPTATPLPTAAPTKAPTAIPTKIPTPTYSYSTPTKDVSVPATATPVTVQPTSQTNNGYSCNCSKTCEEISSCAEAQYQLNACGCSVRDRDNDGIACDSAPLHCQN